MKKTFIAGMAALIFAVVLGSCDDETEEKNIVPALNTINYTLGADGDVSAASTTIILTLDTAVPGLALADIAFDFGATGAATKGAIAKADDKTFNIGINTPAATGFAKVIPALEGYDFQTASENVKLFKTPSYDVKVKLTIDSSHLIQTFLYAMPTDWGDGTFDSLATHTYAAPGEYIVIREPAIDTGGQFGRKDTNDAPMEILEISPSITNARSMFVRCTGLTQAPDLSALSELTNAGDMFALTGLTQAPDLSALSKLVYAYCMFINCTGLTQAPDLSALSKLTSATAMFQGCRNLDLGDNYTLPTQDDCDWEEAFSVTSEEYSHTGSINIASLVSSYTRYNCFANNTALTNYADIPADWR